jgi:hypothetical protein
MFKIREGSSRLYRNGILLKEKREKTILSKMIGMRNPLFPE